MVKRWVTAIVGRRSVIVAAQSTSVSSTFWTERIGSVAELKSFDVIEREKSWEKITKIGKHIVCELKRMAVPQGLLISLGGLPSIDKFSFNGENALAYMALIIQDMLKKGFLAGTSIYASMVHTTEIVEKILETFI